jgi:hypothetical protein
VDSSSSFGSKRSASVSFEFQQYSSYRNASSRTQRTQVNYRSSFVSLCCLLCLSLTSVSCVSFKSATLATDPDDEDIGRIIIIGGWLGTGPLAASDMHVLDISHSGKQLRWYQPAVRGTPPGPCNMHSADYVAARHEVYVFRGGNGREYLNDLHALNTQTFTWRKVETTGAIPQQRANHSSAILEETGELFIFGGWNGTERLNDIHILDTATSTWTCPHAGGVLPHPRAGMTLTALRGRLYLFGGSGTSSKCFQDLQILDKSEMAWLDVTQHEPTNHASGRHRYDSEHHDSDDYRTPRWNFGGYVSRLFVFCETVSYSRIGRTHIFLVVAIPAGLGKWHGY